jgi:hypothetical protein
MISSILDMIPIVYNYLKKKIKRPEEPSKDKNFSYGDFLRNNPNATRKERQDALKRFLDNTR